MLALKKKDTAEQVQTIKLLKSTPMLKKTIYVDNFFFLFISILILYSLFDKKEVTFEVDTGAEDSFMSKTNWLKLGQPELQPSPKT